MKADRIALGLLVALLLVSGVALAEPVSPPPHPFTGAARGKPTALRDLARIIRLGSFPVELEATRLDAVRDHIGVGQTHQAGDASEFLRWYCYSAHKALIWFMSGEIGGGDILTGVVAQAADNSDRRRESCPPVPEKSRPVSFDFGWLGSSRQALEGSLGSPSLKQGEWLGFFFAGKEPGVTRLPGHDNPIKVEFDVWSSVAVRIRADIVVELHVSRTTTY